MANHERYEAIILTDHKTIVKGFVDIGDKGILEIQVDVNQHPYLKNTPAFGFTDILVRYKSQFEEGRR